MTDREKIVEIFDELRNFADNDVHPVVSPENWHVYSKLRDLIDEAEKDVLTLLKEQEVVVRCEDCKHKAESTSPSWDAWCNRLHCDCDNDWFCADWERKGEDNE